jgi:hypothetical protein
MQVYRVTHSHGTSHENKGSAVTAYTSPKSLFLLLLFFLHPPVSSSSSPSFTSDETRSNILLSRE